MYINKNNIQDSLFIICTIPAGPSPNSFHSIKDVVLHMSIDLR